MDEILFWMGDAFSRSIRNIIICCFYYHFSKFPNDEILDNIESLFPGAQQAMPPYSLLMVSEWRIEALKMLPLASQIEQS